jgi:hypothetical protein
MRWRDLFIQEEVHLTEKRKRFHVLNGWNGLMDMRMSWGALLFLVLFFLARLLDFFDFLSFLAFSLAYCQYLLAFSGVS